MFEIFRLVFELTPCLLCLIDHQGKIILVSSFGAHQLGYTSAELIGTNLLDKKEFENELSFELWQKLKGSLFNERVKLFYKNGNRRIWYLSSKEIEIDKHKYLIVSGNDFTNIEQQQKDFEIAEKLYDLNLNRLHKTLLELQKAKNIAEETAKVKQQFIANVSHEIRTPMNAIIGFSNVLLKSNLNTNERQYIEAIKKSGDNLMNIINEILDVSKLESGNFKLEESDFSLDEIVQSVKLLFALRLEDKNLAFKITIDNNVPKLLIGDSGRLYQILINLIGNAIKFTEAGTISILINLLKQEPNLIHLKFSISDTGIGIEEQNLRKIFESFTQASSETTRKYGGTGLGLTICKQLIELQGGTIYAQSIVGKGSTFVFELPFKIAINPNKIQNSASEIYYTKSNDFGVFKLLIVEDNEINILLATKVISDWGFQYDVASNGKIALSKLENEHYDLILMDIQMPIMDGYQATKQIRVSNSKYNKIPIIATTAHAAKEEVEKALAAGMNDYISKPFQLEILIQKILKLLNKEELLTNNGNSIFTKQEKLTNLDYLKNVADGDNSFIERMILLFLSQSLDTVNNIRADLNNNDWIGFRSKIHRFIPSLSFMGITALANELKEINETKTPPQNLVTYLWIIDQLETVVINSCKELEITIKKIT